MKEGFLSIACVLLGICVVLPCLALAAGPENRISDITLQYTSVTVNPQPTYGATATCVADFNNDGKMDFAACNEDHTAQGLHVYLGDGGTQFTECNGLDTSPGGSGGIACGDVNKDGVLEIAYTGTSWYSGSGVHIYKGTIGVGGTMSWSLLSTPYSGSSDDVKIIDINKDGNMDLVYSTGAGVKVILGDGTGTSWQDSSTGLPTNRECTGIAVGDLNGDTYPDIVTGHYDMGSGTPLRVFLQNRSSLPAISWDDAYTGTALATSWGGPECPVIADFNGDTISDLACSYGGNVPSPFGIRVFLGNGCTGSKSGWWTDASTGLPDGTSWYFGMAAADMNLDGRTEIVACKNTGSHEIQIWKSSSGGGGSLTWSQATTNLPTSSFSGYWGVSVGDINNDGSTDIVAANGYGIEAYKNNSSGVPELEIPLLMGFMMILAIAVARKKR